MVTRLKPTAAKTIGAHVSLLPVATWLFIATPNSGWLWSSFQNPEHLKEDFVTLVTFTLPLFRLPAGSELVSLNKNNFSKT